MTATRNPVIDIVKGMAIYLVLCGHVIQYSVTVEGGDYTLNPAFRVIYSFHMPLFVFINGYLMAFSLRTKSPFEVFKIRCKTLLVPWILWGILGALTSLLAYLIDGKDLGKAAWFIWFLYTLFAENCLLLLSVSLKKYLGPASFIVVYVLLLMLPNNGDLSLHTVKWFYMFYLAGYLLGLQKIKMTGPWLHAVIFGVVLISFVVLVRDWQKSDFIHINRMNFLSHDYAREVARMIYRYVTGFLGITLVFYIGHFFSRNKMGGIFARIGAYSMGIYALQRYIVEGIYPRIAARMHLGLDCNSPAFIFIFMPVVAATGTWISMVIAALIFKRNARLNEWLLGGRG